MLPTWDHALDAIGPDDEPWHVARFGDRFDAQGVLSGSKDAGRCIGYLTKYLTKQVADCHQAETDAQRAHAARLAEALRLQPCSPRCANWLRYGIQPKNTRPGLAPGRCKGKAHDADHLGYAGRRVLVSRKWSGKTLADHRADRQDWLLSHPRCFGNRPGPVRLGSRRARPTRITWSTPGGSCTPSPTAPDGKPRSLRPGAAPTGQTRVFRRWEGGVMAKAVQISADRPGDRLMTVAEMCSELGGVSRRTFYRWRELGVGPECLKIPNGELRAWRSDFLAWLEGLREARREVA